MGAPEAHHAPEGSCVREGLRAPGASDVVAHDGLCEVCNDKELQDCGQFKTFRAILRQLSCEVRLFGLNGWCIAAQNEASLNQRKCNYVLH